LNISETTNYYLYIFTKDAGDPKGRLFYWSAGSRGTEKVYNSIVTGSGEIITYTKLLPPSNFTTEIKIISPSGSVPLSWKATEEEYCDGYTLKWQCFNKEGSVFIEGRQTSTYTFNAFELQRGEQLILSLACHHSAD
jgi:hypothetical protein